MSLPIWITSAGSIGVIPEAVPYEYQFDSYNEAGGALTYTIIAGSLPSGIYLNSSGLLYGTPTAVTEITKYTFTVRVKNSTNNVADRTFNLSVGALIPPVINPEPGNLGEYIDGQYVTIQLSSTEPLGTLVPVFSLVSGELPPGLTLTSSGKIYGYISALTSNKNYEFSVQVFDGAKTDTNTFTIYVYARVTLTADNYISADNPARQANSHIISADNSFLTADLSTIFDPILLTDSGQLGNIRQNNIFQYQIKAEDYNNDLLTYNIASGSLPPGLSLNPTSGWITGTVPYGPISGTDYSFSSNVSKVVDGVSYYSETKNYTLSVLGQINNIVNWASSSNLGSIYNGDISDLYISASTPSGKVLQYKLVDSSVGGMPIGLELLPDGIISGRVSFQVDAAEVDYTFTVAAYDINNLVYSEKTFTITVVKRDLQPYENLYIQLMPDREQRSYYDSIVANSDIFPDNYIYRFSDPWFGKNTKRRCLLMAGLNPLEAADYAAAMELNHYWKTIGFGEIKTAIATDENFNTIYEVVYVELLDKSVNSGGLSPNVEISLPVNNVGVSTAYPNSFTNMAQRIRTGVNYENRSILPKWMTSRQKDGTVLGFTRALILCYANPGKGNEIAFRVKQVQDKFKLIDFTVDRYEWDNILSANWLKSPISGTGNITANTNSGNVVGTSTSFSLELLPNASIFVSNALLGNVESVYGDTLFGMFANASGNITGNAFTYDHTFMLTNYTTGTGVITTSNTSNVVSGSNVTVTGTGTIAGNIGNVVIIGNSTSFNTELRVGKILYINNSPVGSIASISNATYLTLETPITSNFSDEIFEYTGNITAFTSLHLNDRIVVNGNVIGTVKTITNDFELVLNGNATETLSNVSYSYTTRDPYTVPGNGDKYLKFPNIRVITSEFTTPEQ